MPSENVVIEILRCDNRLVFSLNGTQIFDTGNLHEDRPLNIKEDISAKLNPGPYVNKLVVTGLNTHYAADESVPSGRRRANPAYFHYKVWRDGRLFVNMKFPESGQPAIYAADMMVLSITHDIQLGISFTEARE